MKRGHGILLLLAMTAVILLLLGWVFSKVDYAGVADAFRSARWGWLPLGILMQMVVFPVKALRWRLILGRDNPAPGRPLLSAIMIGFMINCIFSRIGEIVRPLVLSLKTEVRMPAGLASIALERLFDMCVVLLFLATSLLWLRRDISSAGSAQLALLQVTGLAVAAAFVLLVLFLVFLRVRPEMTTRLVLKSVSWLPAKAQGHVANFLKSFLKGLDAIRSPRQVAVLIALSIAHWMLQVLFFLFIGFCFPALHLGFPAAMLMFAITALALGAVPTPGYIGIYQGGVKMAAAILALGPAGAVVSYAWLAWAASIPPVIVAGFAFLWAEGLTLKQLRGEASRTPKAG